jgi:hypothetical protein
MRFVHLSLAASAVLAATALSATLVAPVAAHSELTVGDYRIALGWGSEPTYVGYLNSVEAIVFGPDDQAVTDLAPGDLQVTLTAAGKTSSAMPLEPAFDTEEGFGTPGDYRADVVPTAPGDYTFHLTGSIHGQAVDVTLTSGPDTFDSPQQPTDVQFPAQFPTSGDLATRLDRVEARAANDAQTALYVGTGVGAAGLLVGLVALALALRSRRRPD